MKLSSSCLLLCTLGSVDLATSFAAYPTISTRSTATTTGVSLASATTDASSTSSTSSNTDDLLTPSYDIERIPLRIGHGFDIHRMAPLSEAGQPVVIGGVVIDHKPQKMDRCRR